MLELIANYLFFPFGVESECMIDLLPMNRFSNPRCLFSSIVGRIFDHLVHFSLQHSKHSSEEKIKILESAIHTILVLETWAHGDSSFIHFISRNILILYNFAFACCFRKYPSLVADTKTVLGKFALVLMMLKMRRGVSRSWKRIGRTCMCILLLIIIFLLLRVWPPQLLALPA